MKKLAYLTAISVFLGAGYAAWVYTPVGKNVLGKWLVKKWELLFKREKRAFSKTDLAKVLSALDYEGHVLLVKLTRFDALEKERKGELEGKELTRLNKLLQQVKATKLLEKKELKPLEGIILPG